MKSKLVVLAAECDRDGGAAALGERVAVMTCLAHFLGFLAFGGAEGVRQPCSPPPSAACVPSPRPAAGQTVAVAGQATPRA